MDTLLEQTNQLARTVDDAGRRKLIDALTDLTYSIESPQDTLQRLFYQHYRIAAIRIGYDLKLFKTLVESDKPFTAEGLAERTEAAPLLLGRILRFLASIRCIKETGQNTYTANNITKTLTLPGAEAGIYHNFDSHGPAIQALPDFLKEHEYQDITESTETPLQKGHNTDLPAHKWIMTVPDQLSHYGVFMAQGRMGLSTWMDVYPYKKHVDDVRPDQPLFVDVGGGIGAEANAFRDAVQPASNEVILQDLPPVLEKAIPHDNVQKMPIDFFEGQPVKGARIYYLRRIMHNYPDDKAVTVLQHIAAAMGPDSVMLIDDIVVPNEGAHYQTMQKDIAMMTLMAALERTKDQWHALAEKAGLKITGIWTYTDGFQESIIECVRSDKGVLGGGSMNGE